MLFSLPEINSLKVPIVRAVRQKFVTGATGRNAPGGNGLHHAVADAVCLGRPLLHIWLLGIRIDANVMQGTGK